MKPSAVVALVAAGAIAGGGLATYELTKPTDSVRVNFVDPAASTATSEPTSATVTVTPTATVTARPAAVTSSSTTHKATVRKEATVSQPAQTTQTSAPVTVQVTPGSPPPVILGGNDQSLAPSPTAAK